MGIVLCDEINAVISKKTKTIVIGGKAQIKNAMNIILNEKSNSKIVCIPDKDVDVLTFMGQKFLYELK